MKFSLLLMLSFFCGAAFCQTLQLQYDTRHTVDPARNPENFVTLYFDYFKAQDSGKAFIKPGSFLLKMQADFAGDKGNMSQFYMQVSQSFRAWRPKIFLNLQYSGGLGITEPKQYSYYIANTFSAGLAYPFTWGRAFLSSVLNYRYVPYSKPSSDFLYTLYWWKGVWNYKAELSGDFSTWTENKNHGDAYTSGLHGKRFYFFAEPQFWYNFNKVMAAGARLTLNYHVATAEDIFQVFPTLAVRCKF